MRNPRIYQNTPWKIGETITLSDDAFGHTVRVLRLKNGDNVTLFNGLKFENDYGEFQAELVNVSKKSAQAIIKSFKKVENESPVNIHLGQAISRGDRMDFTLQKSVELGVNTITPLFTERCGVKISGDRLAKKIEQWQKIVISACEQSGRNLIPTIHPAMNYSEWASSIESDIKLVLHTRDQKTLADMKAPKSVALLVGPEGGITDDEVDFCIQQGFTGLTLGPRILRTETAALAALSLFQYLWGDF